MSRPPKPVKVLKTPIGATSLAAFAEGTVPGQSPNRRSGLCGGQSRDCPCFACANFATIHPRLGPRARSIRNVGVMPRIARRELVDGLCHVTARGNNRRAIFRTDDDYLDALLLLDTAVERYGVVCHAFCLIPNHLHFVLEASQAALSAAMRYVGGVFAQRFHRRYGSGGHVFQGRFHSRQISDDADFLGVVRYVLRNPVRAGLCDSPGEWEWSSYHAYFDDAVRPSFLTTSAVLAAFDDRRSIARRSLAAFVAIGDSPGTVPYPKPYVLGKRSASSRTSRAAGRPTTFR